MKYKIKASPSKTSREDELITYISCMHALGVRSGTLSTCTMLIGRALEYKNTHFFYIILLLTHTFMHIYFELIIIIS